MTSTRDAESQFATFLAKYTPEMVIAANAARAQMRAIVPGGTEFVYDNYNFLVLGYGPSGRPSEAVVSLAFAPRWVTVCFLKGTALDDPTRMLRGSGTTVRNVRLTDGVTLDDVDVRTLVDQAIARAEPAFPGGTPQIVIQSVSAKQRPRRPSR